MLGDTATLNLDFTTGTLDSRLTFTRASTATYINSSGYVTSAAINAPRFDYSPTNIGEPRGLLIEAAATNTATTSETFIGAIYIPNGTTVTVESSEPNPRGTLGCVSFAPTTNGNQRFLGPSIAGFSTTTKVTYSLWLKAKGTDKGVFLLFTSGSLVNSSGVIISQPAGASASFTGNGTVAPTITNLSSAGWTRIAVTTDANFVGTGNFDAFLYPNSTTGQTTNDSLYIWGAQAEQSSNASSYIPTDASQVTRNADQCELTSGVSALYNSATGTGTMLIDVSYSSLVNVNGGIELAAGTGNQGLTNRVSCRTNTTFVGGTPLNPTPTGAGQRFKTVIAFAPSDLAASRNGNSAVTSSTNVTLTGMTALKFYIDAWAGGSLPVYGAVRQVKIWPTRLPNATIQTLSAL